MAPLASRTDFSTECTCVPSCPRAAFNSIEDLDIALRDLNLSNETKDRDWLMEQIHRETSGGNAFVDKPEDVEVTCSKAGFVFLRMQRRPTSTSRVVEIDCMMTRSG